MVSGRSWSANPYLEHMRNNGSDDALRQALAIALSRSVWRKHLTDLDACRMAAADLVKHLQVAGFRIHGRGPDTGPGLGGAIWRGPHRSLGRALALAQTSQGKAMPLHQDYCDQIGGFVVTCRNGCFAPYWAPAAQWSRAELDRRHCKRGCGERVQIEACWFNAAGDPPPGAPATVPRRR